MSLFPVIIYDHSEAVFAEASVDVSTIILGKEESNNNNRIEVLQSNGSSFFVPIAIKEQHHGLMIKTIFSI